MNNEHFKTLERPDAFLEDKLDSVTEALLKAVKPHLKAPLTAVLCDKDELVFVKDLGNDKMYIAKGYVNSQNSYGAMIKTDFAIGIMWEEDHWVTEVAQVGAAAQAAAQANMQQAKQTAQSNMIGYWMIGIVLTIISYLIFRCIL